MMRGSTAIPVRHWRRPYLNILEQLFSIARTSADVAPARVLRVEPLGRTLLVPRGRPIRDTFHEAMERLHVLDVLAAKDREAGPELVVVPDAARGERVTQVPGEPAAADIPVRQDDRLAVVAGEGLTEGEDGVAAVQDADLTQHAELVERPAVVFPFDDDRHGAVLLNQVVEDSFQVLVEPHVVHQRPRNPSRSSMRSRGSPRTATVLRRLRWPPTMRIAD